MQTPISPPPLKRRRLEESEATNVNFQEDLRVFAWNVNGIQPFLHQQQAITSFFQSSAKTRKSPDQRSKPEDQSAPGEPPSLRAFLRRHAFPHILLLQEVKVLAKEEDTVLKRIQNAVNSRSHTDSGEDQEPSYEVYLTLPRDGFNVKGRSYGLATIIRSDLNALAHVRSVDWDLEGRVAVVELNFRRPRPSSPDRPEAPLALPMHADSSSPPVIAPLRNIAVINLYAVNGTSLPYYCPSTGTVNGTRHTHKRALHARLASETRRLKDRGYDVVIAGDFNVAPAQIDGYPNLRTFPPEHIVNRADFHERFFDKSREDGGVQMIDAWRELKGKEKKYSWYPRNREWGSSCDRVDLVLISRELVRRGALKDVGIEDSVRERGPSDHVPIWATIAVTSAQGDKPESSPQK